MSDNDKDTKTETPTTTAAKAGNPNAPNATAEDAAKAAPKNKDAGAEPKAAGAGAKAKMLKAIGVKADDVLAFNAETNTMVTAQGGKYRLSADGKKLIHLAGPLPKAMEGEDK